MALDPNAEIFQVLEGVQFDRAGRGLRTTIYKYTIGDNGPFTIEFTPDQDTLANVEAAINAKAAQLAALLPK